MWGILRNWFKSDVATWRIDIKYSIEFLGHKYDKNYSILSATFFVLPITIAENPSWNIANVRSRTFLKAHDTRPFIDLPKHPWNFFPNGSTTGERTMCSAMLHSPRIRSILLSTKSRTIPSHFEVKLNRAIPQATHRTQKELLAAVLPASFHT